MAVNKLSFDLEKGESLGIVGESGSGKSLTALSIMQLLPKSAEQSGQILWNCNEDLLALPENKIRLWRGAKIGMVFQEPLSSLNPVFTCGEQVAESIQVHYNVSKKEAAERVKKWFQKVQLTDPERIFKSFPHQISGGQRQRVMIAMALCAEPDLLICDEPTTALDVTVQHTILELLIKLRKETGVAIIFISHDLAVIRKIADRVLIMNKGEKVEEGTASSVFKSPKASYTKGLLACRPPLHYRVTRLPVVADFTNREDNESELFLESLKSPEGDYEKRQLSLAQETIILKVKNLNVRFAKDKNWYGKTTSFVDAVKNVSLNLRKGECLGLVGESGSGKTTLGRAILRLVNAESGSVSFLDQEVLALDDEPLRALRPKMQMIFQDPFNSLNPKMKIGDILIEPLNVHFKELSKKEKQERLFEMINKVGLDKEALDRYAHEFSGGQRQRIGIARALLLQPELLICDESVSALDVSVQAQVLNLIKDLKQEYQFSLIFITHDLSVVKFIADTICVMEKGELVEQADTETLFNYPHHAYTQSLLNSILE